MLFFTMEEYLTDINDDTIARLLSCNYDTEIECEMVKKIIEQKYHFTESSIRLLVRNGHLKLLVENGYDMEIILHSTIYYRFTDEEYAFLVNLIKTNTFTIKMETLANFFISALNTKWITIDDIEIFINAGLDPHYDHDKFLITSCGDCKEDVILYFINYGADVNAQGGRALTKAINFKREDLIKILLESGAIVLDCHIVSALLNRIWLPLIKYSNVTFDRVGEIYVKSMFEDLRQLDNDDHYLFNAKILADNNVDFNQIIRSNVALKKFD